MACAQNHTASLRAMSGDPTNTAQIRRSLLKEVRRRFETVRGNIRELVGYDRDAFGLRQDAMLVDAEDVEQFATRSTKVRKFTQWLREQLRDNVLEPVSRREVKNGEHWTATYIRAAANRGWKNGAGRLQAQGLGVASDGVADVMNVPVARRQLRQLYTRAYEELESITAEAAPQVRDTLTKGLAEGKNPKELARVLTKEVRGIQRHRAETLARSEIIHSHTQETLTRYEQAGETVVGHGEWATSGLKNVCPFCRRLGGESFTIDEMRDTLVEFRGKVYRLAPPSHPNGVCTVLPNVGADPITTPLRERVPGTVVS
jgi:SPP1 gp7 family putative phage head morphogenesis protein